MNSRHDALQQVGLRRFIERISKAAHIKKHVVPYSLRHTRLTDLAREGANEALLCQIAGWKLGSKMPGVYIHLSKRDQKPALQKLLGIKREEEIKNVKMPNVCPNCKVVNTSEAIVCSPCRMALDTKTAISMIQERENRLTKMEERLTKFEEADEDRRLTIKLLFNQIPEEEKTVFLKALKTRPDMLLDLLDLSAQKS